MATNRLITMSAVDIYIGTTTNVGNAYTSGSPPVGGYAANILYACTFNATNTGASTLDGYTIQRNGAALVGGEIGANSTILLLFTGILFQLMNYATVPPGAVLVVTATSPVVSSGGTSPNISMPVATTSVDGYLAHIDWNTFNGKVSSVTASAPLTSSGGITPNIIASVFVASGASHASGIVPDPGASAGTTHFLREDATWAVAVTSVTGTSPVVSSGGTTPAISIPAATASVDGYLSHTDWAAFNGYKSGRLLSHTVLTSGTSYTVSSSTNSIVVECVGGGGGGGGCSSAAGASAAGGGGASGGYCRKLFAVIPSTAYTYAVGAGGAGGANTGGNGGNGTDTTFTVGATTINGKHGTGGGGMTASAAAQTTNCGSGLTSLNGDINVKGAGGGIGLTHSVTIALSGAGGNSFYGTGGLQQESNTGGVPGQAGVNGGGGSGALVINGSAAAVGGAGGAGLIVVWEYS